MNVLITGATGFVGTKLQNYWLEKGYTIHCVTTDKEKMQNATDRVKNFWWNPKQKKMDVKALEGVEVIVNLAGASIAQNWNAKGKQAIYQSRIDVSDTLFWYLSTSKHQVTHILHAAAIGIYPSDFTKVYTEAEPTTSNTFLGHVCVDWEEANQRFENLGVKSSFLRFGLICDAHQGALVPMKKICNFFLASGIGTGRQWYSWIHALDAVRMIHYIHQNKLGGVYNCVAPQPLPQKEFMRKLAKKLHKPFIFPNVPTEIIRLVLGEKHLLVTESQRVSSQKIQDKGFDFQFPTFDIALNHLFPKN